MHWRDHISENQDRFIAELLDFVRIPSVSADQRYAADVERAA